jgi:uncharacterized damage-inducible protein DinB
MYRVIKDFVEDWKYESEATLKVFKNLTQESLEQKVNPDGRSLGFIAWHITTSIPEMLERCGFKFDGYKENMPLPEKLEEIINSYEKYSELAAKLIPANWKDENLTDEINMYGEMWLKGKILAVLVGHQAHHRAQMTVLMRQAGLKVPGIYGPSKEEWAQFGMPTQE